MILTYSKGNRTRQGLSGIPFVNPPVVRVEILFLAVYFATGFAFADPTTRYLSREEYRDKCQGAWLGQMVGVCFGDPYEFRSNGKIIEGALEAWVPERVRGALNQDDCYVELTFLSALEKHGFSITPAQAGEAFVASQYKLWHANRQGRLNLRRGLLPPASGAPENNVHADDIDFQIESDVLGVICPGLPQVSNYLCDIFGHLMNYGDGVYGGMFMAGMYTAAFFESENVEAVVRAGLACIPAESQYAQCIQDVLRGYHQWPDDWRKTWQAIETRWNDDEDCMLGDPANIDAKLNGAYVAIGLLYGNGDVFRTMEIAARCGQDADCNASSASGVLGCMKGARLLPDALRKSVEFLGEGTFSYTPYTFAGLMAACEKMAETAVRYAGGTVTEDGFTIPLQMPKAPSEVEQWRNQRTALRRYIPENEVRLWDAHWQVLQCGGDVDAGFREEHQGQTGVLLVHPISETEPALLEAQYPLPAKLPLTLRFSAASDPSGDCALRVFVQDEKVYEAPLATHGQWSEVRIPLDRYSGKTVRMRIEVAATGWQKESAFLTRPVVE